MKYTIVSGTNRPESNSLILSEYYESIKVYFAYMEKVTMNLQYNLALVVRFTNTSGTNLHSLFSAALNLDLTNMLVLPTYFFTKRVKQVTSASLSSLYQVSDRQKKSCIV